MQRIRVVAPFPVAFVGSREVHPRLRAEPHLRLEVRYRPPGATRFLRDIWFIDAAEWLIAAGDVFDGDARVDHIEFSAIRVDTGLPEGGFRF